MIYLFKLLISKILNFLTIIVVLLYKIPAFIFSILFNTRGMPKDSHASIFTDSLPKEPLFKHPNQPAEGIDKILNIFFVQSKPRVDIPKIFYNNGLDGPCSFYIDTYDNLRFLPDNLSGWLQLQFDISSDTRILEMCQTGIVYALWIYLLLFNLRITLFWFLGFNHFKQPILSFTALFDWIYQIPLPGIFTIDFCALFLLTAVTEIQDYVAGLVFTMPYLPSEAIKGKISDDYSIQMSLIKNYTRLQKRKTSHIDHDILIFRNIPKLWDEHGIPNRIREFWFFYKPEDLINTLIQTKFKLNVFPDFMISAFKEGVDKCSSLEEFYNLKFKFMTAEGIISYTGEQMHRYRFILYNELKTNENMYIFTEPVYNDNHPIEFMFKPEFGSSDILEQVFTSINIKDLLLNPYIDFSEVFRNISESNS